MATHTVCESAESLTLGTACHLRESERQRAADGKKVARPMTEGTRVNSDQAEGRW